MDEFVRFLSTVDWAIVILVVALLVAVSSARYAKMQARVAEAALTRSTEASFRFKRVANARVRPSARLSLWTLENVGSGDALDVHLTVRVWGVGGQTYRYRDLALAVDDVAPGKGVRLQLRDLPLRAREAALVSIPHKVRITWTTPHGEARTKELSFWGFEPNGVVPPETVWPRLALAPKA